MIVFEKVSKKFFNDSYGVKEVSFDIEPGELVLITGPTGSGKTTLMRLITKEYLPSAGQILFEGANLAEIKKSLLPLHRRRIGIVFQDYRLIAESNVWENMALPLLIAGKSDSEIEERVTDLLKLVKLEDKAELFPKELSGGEAQKVSIARALATAPPILFADEPTGNLDRDSSLQIIALLKKINELGTTVLISTHDSVVLEEMKNTRHLKLQKGELIKDTHQNKPTTKKAKKEEKVENTEELVEDLETETAAEKKTEAKSKSPLKKLKLKKLQLKKKQETK